MKLKVTVIEETDFENIKAIEEDFTFDYSLDGLNKVSKFFDVKVTDLRTKKHINSINIKLSLIK